VKASEFLLAGLVIAVGLIAMALSRLKQLKQPAA
jgi:hypothetical protein